MRRFMYLLMLIGVSFLTVGCGGDGASGSDPEEGSKADEKAIEDDLGMQDDLMGGDPAAEDGGDGEGAP